MTAGYGCCMCVLAALFAGRAHNIPKHAIIEPWHTLSWEITTKHVRFAQMGRDGTRV